MAKLGGVFDATTVPEREEFTPLVPGQYVGMIVSSEEKTTSKGGKMIVLEIDVQEGEAAGRKLFENLNIENANEKAVDIAFRTLAEIVKAVGKTSIKDTDELHNKRFVITVAQKPAEPYIDTNGVSQPGRVQNVIKKYLPYSGAAPATATAKTEAATAVASKPDNGSVPPWKRKA